MEYRIDMVGKYSKFLYLRHISVKLYNVSQYLNLESLMDSYDRWKQRMPKLEYKENHSGNYSNSSGCDHEEYDLPEENRNKYLN